jgi:hypothetical protein
MPRRRDLMASPEVPACKTHGPFKVKVKGPFLHGDGGLVRRG